MPLLYKWYQTNTSNTILKIFLLDFTPKMRKRASGDILGAKGQSNPRRKEEATEKPETKEDSVQQAAESLEPAE